jgi:hypothetical protein
MTGSAGGFWGPSKILLVLLLAAVGFSDAPAVEGD